MSRIYISLFLILFVLSYLFLNIMWFAYLVPIMSCMFICRFYIMLFYCFYICLFRVHVQAQSGGLIRTNWGLQQAMEFKPKRANKQQPGLLPCEVHNLPKPALAFSLMTMPNRHHPQAATSPAMLPSQPTPASAFLSRLRPSSGPVQVHSPTKHQSLHQLSFSFPAHLVHLFTACSYVPSQPNLLSPC